MVTVGRWLAFGDQLAARDAVVSRQGGEKAEDEAVFYLDSESERFGHGDIKSKAGKLSTGEGRETF